MLITVFICLSDANKAKSTLYLLGMHQNNTSKFSKVASVIKGNNFDKCLNLKDLDSKYINLIEAFLNEKSKQDTRLKITDEYTSDIENWAVGCNASLWAGEAFKKVECIYYSDNAIIICSSGGTIVVSVMYGFFKIDSGKLELVGIINTSVSSLFEAALLLRFDEDLIEWQSEGASENLLTQ